jgi:hypothetical protein
LLSFGSLSNQFIVNGEEVAHDFVKLLNYVECHFLSDYEETGELVSTGGWKFKTRGNEEPSEIKAE